MLTTTTFDAQLLSMVKSGATPPNAAPLTAHSSVFVAPPDFAPDRRPFLSLADELNDRSAARAGPPNGEQLDDWVEDLFERIYETVSMMNVDFWRARRGLAPTNS